MGQQEVLTYLEQHKGEKLSSATLSKILGHSKNNINTSCRKLVKYDMIKFDSWKVTTHNVKHYYIE
jgi:predicted transcriptional regulator